MIYGYWTTHGDYCTGCAVKQFGWGNRRVIVAMFQDQFYPNIPYALQKWHLGWEEGRGFFDVRNKRSWSQAVRFAMNQGECSDLSGGEIDPWSGYSSSPRHRIFCEECGVDLGIEPYCIKEEPPEYSDESCECNECSQEAV